MPPTECPLELDCIETCEVGRSSYICASQATSRQEVGQSVYVPSSTESSQQTAYIALDCSYTAVELTQSELCSNRSATLQTELAGFQQRPFVRRQICKHVQCIEIHNARFAVTLPQQSINFYRSHYRNSNFFNILTHCKKQQPATEQKSKK